MGRLVGASRALVKRDPQDECSVDAHPRVERVLDRPRQRDGGRAQADGQATGPQNLSGNRQDIGGRPQFVYSAVDRWETDVFKFLDANVR